MSQPCLTHFLSRFFGVGSLTSILHAAVWAAPSAPSSIPHHLPPSAQCQQHPPARLLVPASQTAVPGPAFSSNQKDGVTAGAPQSLAGRQSQLVLLSWGVGGKGRLEGEGPGDG